MRGMVRALAAAAILAASSHVSARAQEQDSAAMVRQRMAMPRALAVPQLRACPSAPQQTFVYDTRGNGTVVHPNPLVGVQLIQAGPFAQALLTINVASPCRRANIVVEYEGQPVGWTVNLGDSPSNDGYGGDYGTTPNNAELQVLGNILTVYSSATSPSNLQVLEVDTLSLRDGSLKFVVGNQYLTWGQPFHQVPGAPKLFALPDAVDGSRIYLGINHVVLAQRNRTGTGARRVMISFQ
jgi:hypothetical protein